MVYQVRFVVVYAKGGACGANCFLRQLFPNTSTDRLERDAERQGCALTLCAESGCVAGAEIEDALNALLQPGFN